ncbi:hypothetical protein Tco_0508441 [Tanacetum coccineum]
MCGLVALNTKVPHAQGGLVVSLFLEMFLMDLKGIKVILWGEDGNFEQGMFLVEFEPAATSIVHESKECSGYKSGTTLVPCEDRYVWTLESDGVFSVASIRKEIDGNRFQDVSLPTSERLIMRLRYLLWWTFRLSTDVNILRNGNVWLVSIRIQSKLKGVLEGVYYGLSVATMWYFRYTLLCIDR